MYTLETHKNTYLLYCKAQKCLDQKTIKAYEIDLKQFIKFIPVCNIDDITTEILEKYICILHEKYKPKSAKRKIASLKAFFHYLEYKDILNYNPFNKVCIRFREPVVLPKTIPLHTIEAFFKEIYKQNKQATTLYKKKNSLRDIAVAELLFSTGMRISELCNLTKSSVDLVDGTILISGKGSKERCLQIGNPDVMEALKKYYSCFKGEIEKNNYFFVNQLGEHISEQCIRRMINKYTKLASIELHITPHMFRHTFATSLLEADVDIRYIQEMLGHSSINITEIYTHVTTSKQRDILATKHPRKNFVI